MEFGLDFHLYLFSYPLHTMGQGYITAAFNQRVNGDGMGRFYMALLEIR